MRKVFLFVPCPENYLKPWWSILTSLRKRFQIEVAEAKEVKTKQWDFDSDEEDKDDIEESGESEEEEYSDWRQITKSICCFPLELVGPARGDCFLGIWGGVCSVRFTKTWPVYRATIFEGFLQSCFDVLMIITSNRLSVVFSIVCLC